MMQNVESYPETSELMLFVKQTNKEREAHAVEVQRLNDKLNKLDADLVAAMSEKTALQLDLSKQFTTMLQEQEKDAAHIMAFSKESKSKQGEMAQQIKIETEKARMLEIALKNERLAAQGLAEENDVHVSELTMARAKINKLEKALEDETRSTQQLVDANNACLQENDAIYQLNAAVLSDRLEEAQKHIEDVEREKSAIEQRITDLRAQQMTAGNEGHRTQELEKMVANYKDATETMQAELTKEQTRYREMTAKHHRLQISGQYTFEQLEAHQQAAEDRIMHIEREHQVVVARNLILEQSFDHAQKNAEVMDASAASTMEELSQALSSETQKSVDLAERNNDLQAESDRLRALTATQQWECEELRRGAHVSHSTPRKSSSVGDARAARSRANGSLNDSGLETSLL